MEMFLGKPMEFWCRVRAAMLKTRIETPEALELALGVARPTYRICRNHHGMWEIIAIQAKVQDELILAGAYSEAAANEIKAALDQAAA